MSITITDHPTMSGTLEGFEYDPANTEGLDVGIKKGKYIDADGTYVSIDAQPCVGVPDNSSVFIYIDPVTAAPAFSTTPPAMPGRPVLRVETVGGEVTGTADLRTPWLMPSIRTINNSISAHAGGGQGSAEQLENGISRVTSVATTGDSVILPYAVLGQKFDCLVFNRGANAMDLFPKSGDKISTLAVDTALSVAVGASVILVCAIVGEWEINYSTGVPA